MLPLLEVLCCTAAGRGGVDWYNLCCCGRFRRTPGWRVPWRCSRCTRSSSAPPPAVGAWTGTDSSRCCLWMMPPGSRHATRASWPRFALLAHLTHGPPRGPCLYPWPRCPPSSPLPHCSLPSRPPLCALEILPARCAALYHETSSSPAQTSSLSTSPPARDYRRKSHRRDAPPPARATASARDGRVRECRKCPIYIYTFPTSVLIISTAAKRTTKEEEEQEAERFPTSSL